MAIEHRKHKTKPTTYRVYWTNPITKVREHQSFESLTEATAYDAAIQLRLERDPLSFKERPKQMTFKDLSALYIQKKALAASTFRSLTYSLPANINCLIPNKNILDLTLEDVKRLEDIWEEKGLKANSRYAMFTIIKSILNWGVSKGHIPSNPLSNWKVARGHDEVIPPITKKELDLIYSNASPHIKRVIILVTSLGCRVGQSELFKLRWEHINWEEKLVYVTSAGKNKKIVRRDIFMSDKLESYLLKWYREDEGKNSDDRYIVYYKTNKKSLQTIFVGWKKALRASGITRRIRPYDLRHLFATRTLSAGAPIKAVAETMGHANPTMILRTYQHVLNKDRRAVIESTLLPEDDE